MTYRVKNWKDFQHYKERSPTWIKLHKSLLDDFEFQSLPVASKALAPMLWLLASESKNSELGIIDGPEDKIAFRLRTTVEEFLKAIKPLIEKGFIEDDSNSLAECEPNASPEREDIIKTEKENNNCSSEAEFEKKFEKFWKEYPRKDAKLAARRAFRTACKRVDAENIVRSAKAYANSCADKEQKFIKVPTTWLNGGCWEANEDPKTIDEPIKLPSNFLAVLRRHPTFTDDIIRRWIEPCEIVSLNERFSIIAPTPFHSNWLETKFSSALQSIFINTIDIRTKSVAA